MSFIIEKVELIELPEEYNGIYELYDFKPIETDKVPEIVSKQIRELLTNKNFTTLCLNGVPYEDKVYSIDIRYPIGITEEEMIYLCLELPKFIYANSKTPLMKEAYKACKSYLDEIVGKVGKEITMHELPIDHYMMNIGEYTPSQIRYGVDDVLRMPVYAGLDKDKDIITLILPYKKNAKTSYTPIAKIYIISKEGDIKEKCDKFFYGKIYPFF